MTVRDIAEEAGVSPGPLRHHFGSKETLREEACDVYALERLVKIEEEFVFEGSKRERNVGVILIAAGPRRPA